jgi:hypothetical protein
MANDEPKNQIEVQVITGSGNYPDTGFQHYNLHEKLETVLHQAAVHLKLQNTDGWIARLGDRQLNPALTLADNQIPSGSKIFWAPTERGGGSAAICIQK